MSARFTAGARRAVAGTALGALGSIAYFAWTARTLPTGPSGRTPAGLVLGLLGTLSMLGAAIYSWRRRFVARASRRIEVTAESRRDLLARERRALDELGALQRTLLRNPRADRKVLSREAKKILSTHGVARTLKATVGVQSGVVQLAIERREWGGRLRSWYLWHLSLGTVSVLMILLHSGFRFGNVIATLAFICLVGVVLTGFAGLYLYWTVPPRLTVIEERAERTPEELREELSEVTSALGEIAANKSKSFLDVYNQEIAIPGVEMMPSLRWLTQAATLDRDLSRPDRLRLIVKEIPPAEQEDFRKAMRLIFRKEKIEISLYPQLRYEYLLKVWLSAHIPLSGGMWAFSLIHIVSVLVY